MVLKMFVHLSTDGKFMPEPSENQNESALPFSFLAFWNTSILLLFEYLNGAIILNKDMYTYASNDAGNPKCKGFSIKVHDTWYNETF